MVPHGLLGVEQVLRLQRVGRVVGEGAVGSVYRPISSGLQSPRTAGRGVPAIPFPASATTVSRRIPDKSTSECRYLA
jgi:hypothetical protein